MPLPPLFRFPICLVLLFVLAGCSSDPDPDEHAVPYDPAPDTDDSSNLDTVESPYELSPFCGPCDSEMDCLEEGALCVELFNQERACGTPCNAEGECPSGSFCASIGDGGQTQCIPDELTCADRCDDIICPSGQFCDPLTGDCAAQARICDVGCSLDADCGAHDKMRCINAGAPDGESFCTAVCDPNISASDQLQCPSDFLCIPLFEDAEDGVCFPLARTCVDRCADSQCPAGHNCDPFTGDCTPALVGACEPGCEVDAECGDQADICLNVGIGDAPHCWRDCTQSQQCPPGYQCQSFVQLTQSLCLPINQHCELCADADCFPHGICDPTTGECTPHPEDCTVEGCADDQFCEPASRRCEAYDRVCRGESWAADCDNVFTRCTTQRAGTEGICATICIDDNDCQTGTRCTSTNHGDLCLGPNLGGPSHCGILYDPTQDVGRPCGTGAGACSGSTFCVESGAVPGFCSQECDSHTDCPGAATCQLGPEDSQICLPALCDCVADPGLPLELNQGWLDALDETGLDACKLTISTDALDNLGHVDALLLQSDQLHSLIQHPIAAIGKLQAHLKSLDQATTPSAFLFAAAQTLFPGISPPTPVTPPNDPLELAQTLQTFAESAGGALDPAQIAETLEDIPQTVQVFAASIVEALTEASIARRAAFADAGISQPTLEALFEGAHRLLLPARNDQALLDIEDPQLLAALNDFPLDELTQIALILTARIEAALSQIELTQDDLDARFQAIFSTPAGLIIIGDGDDTTYDATVDPQLDGPIALLIDIGGDDTYRLPIAGNQSVENGVSLLIDLGGDDHYTYHKSGDPLDGETLLPSDDAGRKSPAGPSVTHDGPVSLSEISRQGGARQGIALLFDLGEGNDTYETLRLGQGAAVLGVGALFDDGGNDTFSAEAFAQGASFAGIGLLHNASGDDVYRIWHAGQGYGTAAGLGLLVDTDGDDEFIALSAINSPEELLYHSPTDSGNTNYNLAQGATSQARRSPTTSLAAGLGILRASNGKNTFSAGSYAQGYGESFGLGLLASGSGDDTYRARGHSQGVGQFAGAGLLVDSGGTNTFNIGLSTRQFGQGTGQLLGWGAFMLFNGQNDIRYMTPGGALAIDGGMGFAFFHGGPNHHQAADASMGRAILAADPDPPLIRGYTAAFFVQTGEEDDTYIHPVGDQLGITNSATWRQNADHPQGIGVGLDH